jgi:hypothetical protein
MRGAERPAGQLGCLGCGITWKGTPEQLAQARRAGRAWEMTQAMAETKAKNRAALAKAQAKLERLKGGAS